MDGSKRKWTGNGSKRTWMGNGSNRTWNEMDGNKGKWMEMDEQIYLGFDFSLTHLFDKKGF